MPRAVALALLALTLTVATGTYVDWMFIPKAIWGFLSGVAVGLGAAYAAGTIIENES